MEKPASWRHPSLQIDRRGLGAARDTFESRLASELHDVVFHGHSGPRLPNTSYLSILGISAAEFLLTLDERGVCASAGSACHSRENKPSHVAHAMGLSEKQARETLRFSFGASDTIEDAERAAEIVVAMAQRYRK